MRARTFIVAVPLAITIAAAAAAQEPGTLAYWAKIAKSKGDGQVTVTSLIEEIIPPRLADMVRQRSVVLIEATRPAFHVSVGPQDLFTWHAFKIVESLAEPSQPQTCSLGITLPLVGDEVALGQYGGSAKVDDIAVTIVATSMPAPVAGLTYVAFVERCDGRLVVAPQAPPLDFVKDVAAVGTLQQLRDFIAATATQPG